MFALYVNNLQLFSTLDFYKLTICWYINGKSDLVMQSISLFCDLFFRYVHFFLWSELFFPPGMCLIINTFPFIKVDYQVGGGG